MMSHENKDYELYDRGSIPDMYSYYIIFTAISVPPSGPIQSPGTPSWMVASRTWS
jgi:hypothetical protein